MTGGLTSEEIRAIRKSLGMSQTEFGEALGVAMRTVQNWESSEKPLNHIKSKQVRNLYAQNENIVKGKDRFVIFRGEKISISEWSATTAKYDNVLEGDEVYDLLWENKTLKALLNIENGNLKKYAPSILTALEKLHSSNTD